MAKSTQNAAQTKTVINGADKRTAETNPALAAHARFNVAKLKYPSGAITAAAAGQYVDKAITAFASATKATQVAAVSVLLNAYHNGGYSLADKLVKGIGNGANSAALALWFVKFLGVEMDEANQCFKGKLDKAHIKANLEEAKKTLWTEMKPPQPFKGFDLNAALAQLITRAEQQSTKRGTLAAEGNENAEQIRIDGKLMQALITLREQFPAAE